MSEHRHSHYDTIGNSYRATRAADPRICRHLVDLLALPADSRLIDIGAGTGNYSNALADAGFDVHALEPSPVMRGQAELHRRVHWYAGNAEALPFGDNEFAGAVMTLCLHHLADWRQGIREALRVSGGGPLVIFGFDNEHQAEFWLFHYFPRFIEIDEGWTPTMTELRDFVQEDLQGSCERFPFPLPKDLTDHFAGADWAHPDAYLREEIRAGISSFARLDQTSREQGLKRLAGDLNSGDWLEKYRELLKLEEYHHGYLFLRIRQG